MGDPPYGRGLLEVNGWIKYGNIMDINVFGCVGLGMRLQMFWE